MKTVFIIILLCLIVLGLIAYAVYMAFKNAVDYPDEWDDNPMYAREKEKQI